jgi:hypothetical protein
MHHLTLIPFFWWYSGFVRRITVHASSIDSANLLDRIQPANLPKLPPLLTNLGRQNGRHRDDLCPHSGQWEIRVGWRYSVHLVLSTAQSAQGLDVEDDLGYPSVQCERPEIGRRIGERRGGENRHFDRRILG